jgi:hypothetical protein
MSGIKKRKQATKKNTLPRIAGISPFIIPEIIKKIAQTTNKIQPHNW